MASPGANSKRSHQSFQSASLSEDADEHDDCCAKSGVSSRSLEDTLSLTCDESMSSSMSSSSIVDHHDDDSSTSSTSDNEIEIYESPHILRRRLLPLPPSPIIPQCEHNLEEENPIHSRRPFENVKVSSSWKKRPSIRILGFLLGLTWIVYLLSVSADYHRWMPRPALLQDHHHHHGSTTTITTSSTGRLLLHMSKEAQEWRRFVKRRAPKILHKVPSKSSSREYTIRIRGHRVDLIKQSLDFHASCPSVKSVQVEWTGGSSSSSGSSGKLPPSLMQHRSGKVKPLGKPSTSAVFLLDEDLILSCQEIERAFNEWKLDPSRMVGFYPFHHTEEESQSSKKASSSSKSKSKTLSESQLRPVSRGGSYSMVSDRAVFIHSHILRSIPKNFKAPSTTEDCQPLGMSILVSSMTSKPPVVVLSKPQTLLQQRKSKQVSTKHVNQACQEWIESIIGAADHLPNQIATIVGHEQQQQQ